MNTNHACSDPLNTRLSIRLEPFPVDPRACFVERVCSVLIESRFEGGIATPFEFGPSEAPEPRDSVCYDLTIGRQVPFYFAPIRRGMADRRSTLKLSSQRRRVRLQFANGLGNAVSPSNPGRGSPPYEGGVAPASGDGVVLSIAFDRLDSAAAERTTPSAEAASTPPS